MSFWHYWEKTHWLTWAGRLITVALSSDLNLLQIRGERCCRPPPPKKNTQTTHRLLGHLSDNWGGGGGMWELPVETQMTHQFVHNDTVVDEQHLEQSAQQPRGMSDWKSDGGTCSAGRFTVCSMSATLSLNESDASRRSSQPTVR